MTASLAATSNVSPWPTAASCAHALYQENTRSPSYAVDVVDSMAAVANPKVL